MKLVWSPEMASKAYIDTVKTVRTTTTLLLFFLASCFFLFLFHLFGVDFDGG